VQKFLLLGLLLATPALGQDQAQDLRTEAGCGPAKMKFDVKVDQKQHAVTQPEAGKALVYLIEQYQSDPHSQVIGHVTTRVGLDGKWVGATHEGSYMAFSVEAGTRRVCSDVQSIFAAAAKLSGAFELNAEPGRTYYLRVLVVDLKDRQPHLRVAALDEAEGLLMVSKTGRGTWKVKP
jgi:hypothetical protein